MGSRADKSLQDKLKVFFKKGAPALPPRNELVLTAELERDLGADTPLHRRLRAIKDVSEKAINVRIPEGGVEKLWTCTRDLLEESNAEARHAVLGLMRAVAEGQADHLQIMRTIYFHYLRDTHPTHSPDDTHLRFKLLHTLTNSGKNINCFEEQIGQFLLEWLARVPAAPLLGDLLLLITNVVKFNATYLDEHIVHGIVNGACELCVYSAESGVVSRCLALLEAVVSYSLLPRAALPAFVAALCRTVNVEQYCQNSWKLMRYVVGGDIGHAALHEMVEILRAGAPADGDAGLVRGAVFYINMALWGPRRVPTLKVSFLAVLPAFLKALEGNQPVVTYEVVVGVARCVARAPRDLTEPAWDVLLRVLRQVVHQDKTYSPPNEMIHSRLHALITSIEELADGGQYCGDPDALLDLVDCCGHDRPEASTMRLVRLRAGALAGGGAGAARALALGDRYLRHEPRLAVRLHTLHHLLAYMQRHRHTYGGEVVEAVGAPLLGACALDAEGAVRAAAARALAPLAAALPADRATDLIDLLEKILNRPFEMYVTDVPIPAEAEPADLRLAASGLLQVLHRRLLAAPAHVPTRCFLVLLDHLDHHYKRPALFHHHPDIRLKIFEMLFGLRANEYNCVGFCYDSQGAVVTGAASLRLKPACSPFLLVEPPAVRGQAPAQPPHLPPGACVLPAGRAARLVAAALAREAEWAVVGGVLRALPALLQARGLAVGRRAQDVDLLASTLCSMVSDRSLYYPECLRAPPGTKLLLSDFHAAALPALAALAPYHACLEPQTQQRIVRCLLKYGMVLRQPQPYILALTVFTLETRDTMVRMLPEVLLDLSKISDTQAIASPMLEFLSTLTRLPKVFASFVEDQYMSVFAILLPYTNPSRYNHYVVSLAHHVIAAWFLKCRLPYRRNFVRFIIHGLHNYIIMPFEEQLQYKSNFPGGGGGGGVVANEDSSNRQRSSSLGSRAVSRAPVGRGGAGAGPPAAFHVELTETCVDLLARYTTTPCNVKPTRSDLAEFLFTGGQSMTWLVGHKLVTITTSGCTQNPIGQGCCDRCAALCRQHAESVAAPLPPLPPLPPAPGEPSGPPASEPPPPQLQLNDGDTEAPVEVKRYSKHSLQHSRSTDTSSSLSCSDAHHLSSGHSTRQNSSENNKASDPLVEVLNQFSQRFERISKEVDSGEATWRGARLGAGGGCPCWCGAWAEVHVRSPTGDLCATVRVQNQMNWANLSESPLEDVAALLDPPAPPAHQAEEPAGCPRDSMLRDLHKSSSDSVVSCERRASHGADCAAPHPLGAGAGRLSTQPINIPGSPQRQAAAGEDDMLLVLPEGKSRHPVRRSNSSPEMSSSWKGRADTLPADPMEMILLPSCEPTVPPTAATAAASHTKKPAKKSDMRVSCEAIPEEISGTSPATAHVTANAATNASSHATTNASVHAITNASTHPHLMTFNSDPAITGSRVCAGAEPPAEHHHHQLQKTASDGVVGGARRPPRAPNKDREDLPPLARSKRSNTISVMSPTRRYRPSTSSQPTTSSGAGSAAASTAGNAAGGGGGVTPSFVFLQLYHNMSTYPITPPVPGETQGILNPLSERPLRVSGEQHERTIKNLDLVPPVEIYKVGVLYVAPGQQESDAAALRNTCGSVRYAEFLGALGSLVPLHGAPPPGLFLNLDRTGKDGAYAYVWQDDHMQVVFHVATAMPTSAQDPGCNEKRKYIGNDYVSIVYNDSGADFSIHTIKGQFNLCIVVVEPGAHGTSRVYVRTKDERIRTEFLPHLDAVHCVSDTNVALLARQLALHCALASQISQSLKLGGAPYASNCLERLRAIKRLRRRLEAERAAHQARAPKPYAHQPQLMQRVAIDDFNDYT